jgi:hypothetical protein
MTTNQTDATTSAAPASTSTRPPSSGARLIVLLGLLGLVIGAYAYDYGVARPAVDAAEKRVNDFVDARNRLGVKEGSPVTPDAVHKELGMKPTFVEKHPADYYEVEYYCWWGHVPVINLRRHFLALVYVGDEPRRFSSHHKNEVPPAEALPIMEKVPPSTEEQPPQPGAPSAGEEKKKADSEKSASSDAPAPKADK